MARKAGSRKDSHKDSPVKDTDLSKEKTGFYLESSSTTRVALKMPSDVAYLDEVLDYLSARMQELGIMRPGDCEMVIALDEAIVNAIKHGNKNDPRKAVHIVAEMSPDRASFIVTDEGSGFVQTDIPDPTHPSRLLEPSGRGLLLIKHIMDEVTHNECGNEIHMSKHCCVPSSRSKKRTRRS
jgi:serine/threonine-protein kinase RsbW